MAERGEDSIITIPIVLKRNKYGKLIGIDLLTNSG
jgi:hypothetical protein